MPLLVDVALLVRRSLRGALPIAGAAVFGALVARDAQSPVPTPVVVVAVVALAGGLAALVRRRSGSIEASRLLDFQIGVLSLAGVFGLVVRLDGSLDGPAYPLVYMCIALLSAVARPAASLSLVVVAGLMELAVRHALTGSLGLEPQAPHLGFMAVFAALNVVLLRAEIARVRRASRAEVQAEVERLRSDARSFRLLGVPEAPRSRPRQDDEERIFRSGVEEIHQSVLLALRLLRESLGLHTAMLLWGDDTGAHFRISELASDAHNLVEGPFLAGDGIWARPSRAVRP